MAKNEAHIETDGDEPHQLLSEWKGSIDHTVVVFGGSPIRRDEVVRLVGQGLDITVIGTLNEAEGMAALMETGQPVSLVLIGGQYTLEQRKRIHAHVKAALPGTTTSEPGQEYPYSNENIVNDVATKLHMPR